MLKHYCILLLVLLSGCSNDSQAEKETTLPVSMKDVHIKHMIALNSLSCFLTEEGKVFCWKPKKTGAVQITELISVDLGIEAKATSIYGNSGDVQHFDTGYHACALMDNNSIRCWGEITEQTVSDANSIFDMSLPQSNDNGIPSFIVKKNIIEKIGKIKSIITDHRVVCAINTQDKLYCPHPRLSFLNGMTDIKNVVIGELLSCTQTYENNEVTCYDMRGEPKPAPVYLSLAGKFSPETFTFRYVYSLGVVYIDKNGSVMYWRGQEVPFGQEFPGVYDVKAVAVSLPDKTRATSVHISEITTCLQLSDGSATCWGPLAMIDDNTDKPPGKRIDFGANRKIVDIALGESYNCFWLSDNSIECSVYSE